MIEDRERVLRGGSWPPHQGDARCSYRNRLSPDLWPDNLGVRVSFRLIRRTSSWTSSNSIDQERLSR